MEERREKRLKDLLQKMIGRERRILEGGSSLALEERQTKLKREAAKLMRESNGDWRKLGEALYSIYKSDKNKAFELINIIAKLRNNKNTEINVGGKKAEEFLNLLFTKRLRFSIDGKGKNGERAKAVLGLAALSSLNEIKNEKDVKKAFAVVVLREAVMVSDPNIVRELNISFAGIVLKKVMKGGAEVRQVTAKLIGKLRLQKELKPELMLLMSDINKKVRKAAKAAWKRANLGDVKREYEKMSKEEKMRVKELIKKMVRSDHQESQYTVINFIRELGSQREFKAELMLLMSDGNIPLSGMGEGAWEAAGFGDVKEEYEKMSKEDQNYVKVLIAKTAETNDVLRLYGLLNLIIKLGLQDEFKGTIWKLISNKSKDVRKYALEVLIPLMKKEIVEMRQNYYPLANPFTLSEDVKLTDELTLAMALLCL